MSLQDVTKAGLALDTLPTILAELQGLSFTAVVGAAAGTALAVAGIETEDTVVAVVDMTTPGNFSPANVTVTDRRASGTITCLATLVDGDTVTVNGKVYTFKLLNGGNVTRSMNIAPYQVPIVFTSGTIDTTKTAAALAVALMSGDNNLICTSSTNVVTIIWSTRGTAGNAITLATSGAHATVSGATLANGTATNSIKTTDNTAAKNLVIVWFNKP